MKARLLGPLLMVCLGAALLGGAVLPDPLDVGIATTTTTDPCAPQVGQVNPCTTTTTEAPATTTTAAPVTTTTDPCTTSAVLVVEPCEETTTTTEPTSEATTTAIAGEPTTTAGGGVLPGGAEVDPTDPTASTPTNPAASPAVSGGELARTGSNDGPLAAAGIALILTGIVLAILGRRHQLADER